jgi:hypothetical protein
VQGQKREVAGQHEVAGKLQKVVGLAVVAATSAVAAREAAAAATTTTAAAQALAGSCTDRKVHTSDVPGVAVPPTVEVARPKGGSCNAI